MKLTKSQLKEIIKGLIAEAEDTPEEPELKTDIPDSPFGPDLDQVVDELKVIVKQWQKKEYRSDEMRWKSYYYDIAKLVKRIANNETN